ncbi:phage tail protein [Methylobacterium haplocladii]|uniref:Phage tail protein n=1 Tax=Methylobacterium haplocladii TaxID=1176176 RepID=A0A512ISH1_9HYPH|nr:phage tail protein [Methylobacterium haplocladii]GEP00626.1 hypothetical protein MHA02_30130 [Methylobacterium haplocladii]GJD85541.1 hypothetical protein HPGCJGGD_3430 [Methylobacterium haplocladii]GLS57774.1 hypothetical protein GCM10007887_04300 [Methylobacterium haplocladii]
MPDLSLMIGSDLSVGPTGDLLLVDGTQRGVQRVLRRLLTVAGTYIQNLGYGAGVQLRVGGLIDADELSALIRSQIFREASVARDPDPVIVVTPILNGVHVRIIYADAATGRQQTLSFEVP